MQLILFGMKMTKSSHRFYLFLFYFSLFNFNEMNKTTEIASKQASEKKKKND